MYEVATVIVIIAAAIGFSGWRVWQTLRVASGDAQAKACGGCKCPSERTQG